MSPRTPSPSSPPSSAAPPASDLPSRARLEAAASAVGAPAVDVRRLLRTVAWLATPGRGADTLRRRCADPQMAIGGEPQTADGSLDAVLSSVPPATGAVRRRVLAALVAWAADGVRVATVDDDAFPAALATGWPDRDVPPLLAWRGTSLQVRPRVAIVGARRASSYGTGVAAWLGEGAANAGVEVVSGGARGVDAAAHRACLEAGGATTVVLGCGHDVPYPREHARPGGLFDQVLAAGGTLLSEHLPGARPHAGNVRARNRIVAALADAVVVVEGGARSGALLTASAALDHDVSVLAVPGDVRAPGSEAPHRLLAEGAAPCTSPADLLAAVAAVPGASSGDSSPGASSPGASSPGVVPPASVLPTEVHAVLADAWPRPLTVDEVAERSGRPAGALLGMLTRAAVAGEVARSVEGVRLRRAPSG